MTLLLALTNSHTQTDFSGYKSNLSHAMFTPSWSCDKIVSLLLVSIISYFLLPPVNCSDPTPPTNGSIDPYQNTTEGAVISFMCT